ncbi:cytochrome P450 [Acidocella aquatica]|nr:cytochrome P450 [Acidocella aquatica]
MSAAEKTELAPIPGHVPLERVYDFDYIYDARLLENPHERMKSLHKEAPPLFYSPRYGGHWVVTGKEELRQVACDPELFTSVTRGIPAMAEQPVLIPLTFDPPRHTQYRAPLNAKFTAKGVAPLEGAVRAMAAGLIDAVAAQGYCEFMNDVAEPLPPTLFFNIAGMPTDRLKEFRQLAEDATAAPDPCVRMTSIKKIAAILKETVDARMAEPRDDLISEMVTKDFGGQRLTPDEILNYAVLLFLGGLETVVNALCFTARYLALHPALQAELRADPTRIPLVMEEMLRLHGIAMAVRRATRDTELDGVAIQKDDMFMLMVPAVNYDPVAFENAESMCPGRKEALATFNMGPHRCIGANLARLEMRVFFEEWLKRIPEFRLDQARPPKFFGGLNLAVRSLNLVWG